MSAVSQSTASPNAVPKPQRYLSIEQRQRRWGWLFLSPWIIGFFAFTLMPMAASLYFTFTDFILTESDNIHWVGLDNWTRALRHDPDLGHALLVTLKYAAFALPFAIIFPIALATLLNMKQLWAKSLFRTLFYMPFMVPVISFVYIWRGYLNAETGWLNRGLAQVGVTGPVWLQDVNWIYPALVLIGLWGVGNAMLITLAGLQTVPTELYEAARVDGAGPLTLFRRITFPMISPIVFYNLVLTLIGLFRYFEVPYILTEGQGDPGNSTLFYNLYFYRTAFSFQNMAYGATLAWILFIIAFSVTMFVFATARYWVFYAGGEE